MDLSFTAFVASSPGGTEIPIEVQWLRYVDAVRYVMDDFAEHAGYTDSQTRLIFAELIAACFLGDEWVDEQRRRYRGKTTEEHGRFRYVQWRLGRLLFDLQTFPWFEELTGNVRRRNLAGALFEAEVARLLMQLPVTAELRVPRGAKGQDYDIDLTGSWLTVSVEVKAKDDDTPYSAQTVRNTIEQARRQLPRDGLGLIFLRVPIAWTQDARYEAEIDSVVASALRNTARVQAVILVWDILANRTATTMRFEPRQRVLRRADVHPDVDTLLRFFERVWGSEWDVVGPATAL